MKFINFTKSSKTSMPSPLTSSTVGRCSLGSNETRQHQSGKSLELFRCRPGDARGMAVRQGFEPWVPFKGYNALAKRRFRPLSHLTNCGAAYFEWFASDGKKNSRNGA